MTVRITVRSSFASLTQFSTQNATSYGSRLNRMAVKLDGCLLGFPAD